MDQYLAMLAAADAALGFASPSEPVRPLSARASAARIARGCHERTAAGR